MKLAALILDWIISEIGVEEEFRYDDLVDGIGLRQETIASAMADVAKLAAEREMCLTTPCFANNYTMVLTEANADAAVDSMLHVGQTRRGVELRESLMGEFSVSCAKPGSDAAFLAMLYREKQIEREAQIRKQAIQAEWLIDKRRADREKAQSGE